MEEKESKSENVNNQMPVPKIRHDWYQTDTHVVITVLAKNLNNVKVENTETSLSISAKLPNGSDYSLELDLLHSVLPNHCPFKVFPSKLEVKLKKQEGCRWNTLEGPATSVSPQPIPAAFLQNSIEPPKYPSSSKKATDWNKVEKEIEKEAEETPEGEAAVNALFQNIYGKGSDEVRRAMNKSFIESGGTVLSTNWEEVGKGRVERKPPDSTEWKSWN